MQVLFFVGRVARNKAWFNIHAMTANTASTSGPLRLCTMVRLNNEKTRLAKRTVSTVARIMKSA